MIAVELAETYARDQYHETPWQGEYELLIAGETGGFHAVSVNIRYSKMLQ